MIEPAFRLIMPYLQQADTKTLWLVDENLTRVNLDIATSVQVVTNRIDVQQHLQAQGCSVDFSDFDLSFIASSSLEQVVYRISKERAVVNFLLNEAWRCLKQGGQLVISGSKGEGIKGYFSRARKLFGAGDSRKADKDNWIMQLVKTTDKATALLDDKDYKQLRVVATDELFEYQSKPGIFGWDKIDKGSKFLIENLDSFLMTLPEPPKNALDLGCGYGYLSLHLMRLDIPIVATDNNAAAIAACEHNFNRYPINARVYAADCATGINNKFDLILCNPPFHSGFSTNSELTDSFLQSCYHRLTHSGIACFVTNIHIAIETKARQYFHGVECIASNGNFKLIRLTHKV